MGDLMVRRPHLNGVHSVLLRSDFIEAHVNINLVSRDAKLTPPFQQNNSGGHELSL